MNGYNLKDIIDVTIQIYKKVGCTIQGEELAMILTAIVIMFSTSILGVDLFIPDKKETDNFAQPYENNTTSRDWY